jgi:hypothetical protein
MKKRKQRAERREGEKPRLRPSGRRERICVKGPLAFS